MSAKHRHAVVIGSSSGGIDALQRLVAKLPADFAAPIFIVQHLSPSHKSFLPQILNSAGPLRTQHPKDGDPIEAPGIYVAPPDHHLLVEESTISVKRGPKENRHRPSIDALFRSAAHSYGAGTIGVVLTGALTDGTSGLWTIKRLGGTTIVQDPNEALMPSMPLSALREVSIDYSEPVAGIPEILMNLIAKPLGAAVPPSPEDMRRMSIERAIAAGEYPLAAGVLKITVPSRYTCAECSGVLGRIVEGSLIRYRCHTGHAYTQESLLTDVQLHSEEKLAQAITLFEEGAMLLEEIGRRRRQDDDNAGAMEGFRRAKRTKELVRELQELVLEGRTALARVDDALPENVVPVLSPARRQ